MANPPNCYAFPAWGAFGSADFLSRDSAEQLLIDTSKITPEHAGWWELQLVVSHYSIP